MWTVEKVTHPVARKEYKCDACFFLFNSDYEEKDYHSADWNIIREAEQEKWKILPGDTYLHVRGLWEGKWTTFRARLDIHTICLKYDFYDD